MLECEFYAAVADGTHICSGSITVANVRGSGDAQEHVLSVSDKEVHRGGELVFPQAKVHTGVHLLGCLPHNVGVHKGKDGCTVCQVLVLSKDVVNEGGAAVEHCLHGGVVSNLVIADTAPAGTDLQAFQPSGLVEPGFVVHTPSGGHGGEEAPNVVGELRCTIGTEVNGKEITAVIVVVGAGKE